MAMYQSWANRSDGGTPLLEVSDLRTYFYTPDGVVKAVDGVNLHVRPRETLCIVGESGSGKTMTALSVMRLVQEPPGKIVGGTVRYGGTDLLGLSETQMCRVRGKEIGMIFQDPMTALDPLYRVGHQIEEALEWHYQLGKRARREKCVELLRRVGIADAESRCRAYPHQFSGGMLQRVMIAMALSCGPKLLIADEPTTALDVTIEAQIVELIRELQRDAGMAVLYITHNMGLVAKVARRVAVMYAGSLVETAPSKALFGSPKHPYTMGLLRSVPRPSTTPEEDLPTIEGSPPDLIDIPDACPFAPRCDRRVSQCWRERPRLREVGPDHHTACFVDL